MIFFWIPVCFLIGSFPTAYLVGRLRGVDIRTVGSGNAGATNVFRTLGKAPGILTLSVDIVKGLVPVLLARSFFPLTAVPVISGLAAVAGHSWSPFLRFKGGKGVATSAGVFLGLAPWAGLLAIAVFLGVFLWTRTVSIGSLAAAAVLPTASFLLYGPAPASWLALTVTALVVVKHVPNIRRLLKGEELAFGKKP